MDIVFSYLRQYLHDPIDWSILSHAYYKAEAESRVQVQLHPRTPLLMVKQLIQRYYLTKIWYVPADVINREPTFTFNEQLQKLEVLSQGRLTEEAKRILSKYPKHVYPCYDECLISSTGDWEKVHPGIRTVDIDAVVEPVDLLRIPSGVQKVSVAFMPPDFDFSHLKRLDGLVSLSLLGETITKTHLQVVKQLDWLECLQLCAEEPNMGDELALLKDLVGLRKLELHSWDLTNDVNVLVGFSGLTHLKLYDCCGVDKLSCLEKMGLEHLVINRTGEWDDIEYEEMDLSLNPGAFMNLQVLELQNEIGPIINIDHLVQIKTLKRLRMLNRLTSAAELEGLLYHLKLESLSLHKVDVLTHRRVLDGLVRQPLSELDLDVGVCTDDLLKTICSMDGLERLSLSAREYTCHEACQRIGQLKKLRNLRIYGKLCQWLVPYLSFTPLHRLVLGACLGLNHDVLINNLLQLKQVRYMRLSRHLYDYKQALESALPLVYVERGFI